MDQVAANQEYIGASSDVRKKVCQYSMRRPLIMKIGNGCDTDFVSCHNDTKAGSGCSLPVVRVRRFLPLEVGSVLVPVKLLVVVMFEIARVKLRAGFYFILRQVQIDVGVSPIHMRNPLRRNQNFLARPPGSTVDDNMANGPLYVVDDKVAHVSDVAICRL